MNRHPLGRARLVAVLSTIPILAGSFLPWFVIGGETGIPPVSGSAFDSIGILVFLVGPATLALVALPFAAGDRPVAIDHWMSYLVLVVVGFGALALRVVELVGSNISLASLLPTRAPGIWLAGLGLIGVAWAASDLRRSRPT